jgi:diguanylate cyclase (GGDEF)-like protein
MKPQQKIYAAILAALVIGSAFFYVNDMTRRRTMGWDALVVTAGELEKLEKELDGEVLQSSFFLYHNYDRINGVIRNVETKLTETRRRYLAINPGRHPVATDILSRYETAFTGKKEAIALFLSANSTIKNSSLYIPVLLNKYIASYPVDPVYLNRLSSIASSVYLAKNGLDQELVASLGQEVAPLQRLAPTDPGAAKLHRAFVAHLQVFVDYFPEYSQSLTAILAPTTGDILQELQRHIAGEQQRLFSRLSLISLSILVAFLSSIGLIVMLLLRTGRENIKLVELQRALTAAATTDRLTGLANRFAFDSDVEQFSRPLLFLVNVDDFKHVNDIYGVRVGDFLLRAIAARLSETLTTNNAARLYRLGGDDFGILIEDIPGSGTDLFAQSLLEVLENVCFTYQDQAISVSISVGVSAQQPILETADLALHEVKKKSRLKYLIYSDTLNIQTAIATNLKTLISIRHALENDGVLVYFQPIADNRTGVINKYECLIRLRTEAGTILAPGAFLDLTKESPLYPELTRAVIKKSFQAFRGNNCEFSINLSVMDILDQSIHEYIIAMLDEEPDLARRLTFEILEGEGVENYEAVHGFIRQIKARGCRIAVDDFGAGYSNFNHILKLQVDSLKIDASLIKHLDTDRNALILVRTIVDFCRALNIQTVAEFVHSAAVHQAVCALGIDYTQGYYVGKPLPELPPRSGAATKAPCP